MSSPRSPVSIPAPTISSSYPLPPTHLIGFYTDENINNGIAPDPPAPINDGVYSMFGVERTNNDDDIRPLEAQDIKRLYPRVYDHKEELKKMNSSILINFLDLLDINVKCPDTDKRLEKCADIAMLFIQMHHLINEMRPHQAREAIRVALCHQNKQRVDIFKKLIEQMERVVEIVSECTKNIPNILEQTIDFDVSELCAASRVENLNDQKQDKTSEQETQLISTPPSNKSCNDDSDRMESDCTDQLPLSPTINKILRDEIECSNVDERSNGQCVRDQTGEDVNVDNEKDSLMCDIVESLIVV